jgi:hypothetical protein
LSSPTKAGFVSEPVFTKYSCDETDMSDSNDIRFLLTIQENGSLVAQRESLGFRHSSGDEAAAADRKETR